MSLKILHTADFHFRGKGLEEIEKCVRFIVAQAKKESPDVIVISGDITDSRSLQLESKAAQVVFDIIREMLSLAPVAIVTGTPSHDGKIPLALRSLKGKFPILVSDMPEQWGHDCNGWNRLDSGYFRPNLVLPDFIITQLPTPTKQYFVNDMNIEDSDNAIADAMGILFSGYGQHASIYKDVPHIVSGHLSVGGAFISETQQLIGRDIEVSKAQLGMLKADVVCLGHIHKSQQIGDNIFYSGSPARMNFGEKEEKGFYFHELSNYPFLLISDFIKTPARNLIEIKKDCTAENFGDINFWLSNERAIGFGFSKEELQDSSLKITLTMWQDDAAAIDPVAVEKYFIDAGCHNVKFLLIRKPRETVRSEKVLEAESLPDKLAAMAELRGEIIDGAVIFKAGDLEANESEPWARDYDKIVKEN